MTSLNASAREFQPVLEEADIPELPNDLLPSSEDQTEMLKMIFPELSYEDLQTLYVMNDLDLMRTVQQLLDQYSETENKSQTSSEVKVQSSLPTATLTTSQTLPRTKSQVICKYFLQGQCLIRNCEFLHSRTDRQAICKFWLKGFCARGDSCAFLHELESVVAAADLLQDDNVEKGYSDDNEGVWDTSEVFNAKSVSVPAQKPNILPSGEWSLSTKLKLESLEKEFSNLHPGLVKEAFEACSLNSLETRQYLSRKFRMESQLSATPYIPKISLRDEKDVKTPVSNVKTKVEDMPNADLLPWLQTGDKMNSLYLETRKEAEEHSKKRNYFFMLATKAFMQGDGKKAKEFSKEGRKHDAIAKELHAKAAQGIFEQRNKKLKEVIQNRNVIDVHGLHPDEAVEIVHNKINEISQRRKEAKKKKKKKNVGTSDINNGPTALDVITGTGHHSYGREAKVLPAVQDFVFSLGYSCKELDAGGGKGGVLRIHIL